MNFPFERLPSDDRTENIGQVLDGPIGALGGKLIGGGAMLPDRVLNRFARLLLQSGLGEQSAEIARQQIAAAALGEVRVARTVHEKVFAIAANHGLMAL